jgi:APA family basic amino acid/polyamine antiporter
MMGNMIGVGIFIYPILISSHLPHPIWFVAIWLIGGLIALTGALSSAELGTFFPEAGGDYAYLRNSYGKRFAFLYGFLTFFITYPGSIAIGVGLTLHYQGESLLGSWVQDIAISLPIPPYEIKYYQLMAAFVIIILTIINHIGIQSSFLFQKIVTLLPIGLLTFVCLLSLYFVGKEIFFYSSDHILASNLNIPFKSPKLLGLGAALVPVYWTFAGWNSPLTLGEEIKDPHRIIPLAMILGPIFVTLLYLLFSFVFISVVPYTELQAGRADPYLYMGNYFLTSLSIQSPALSKLLPKMISFLILLIVLGNTNSAIVSGSRIYVAMARDRLFWEKVGYIDPIRKSPTVSIWLQSLWAILLVLIIHKESNLLNFSFIAITLLSVMTIFSIFLVRLRKVQVHLLYKTYGYPITPILYIVSSLTILGLIIAGYIVENKLFIIYSSAGTIVLGLVVYEFWKKFSYK